MKEKPTINILTRTSNRPNSFNKCVESIKNQTYKKINHIVSVDNDITEEYVKKHTNNYIKVKKYDGYIQPLDPVYGIRRPAPYNLYLNDLKNQVKDGWIMFLDDDDVFLDDNALFDIVSKIKSNNEIIFWKVKFSETRIIPSNVNFNNRIPILNDFDMNGFMFHSKYKNYYNFDYYSAGDFFCVKYLENFIQNKNLIDKVYTGTQRNNGLGGQGNQKDI